MDDHTTDIAMNFTDQKYAEQVDSISENAVEKAATIYNHLVDHLLDVLNSVVSFDDAIRRLALAGVDMGFVVDFGQTLKDALELADGLGRTIVADKDAFYSSRKGAAAARFNVDGTILTFKQAGVFACKDDRVKVSFDLVPEYAAQYMRRKAFWIAGIENDELLKSVQKSLEEALRNGETWNDWRRKADQLFEQHKVKRLAPHRLQNVFRTNLFTSYSVAQLEQINQMRDRFPFWRYVAILDSATRPEHAALNGNTYRVGEGPYPPLRNGESGGQSFNCRCSAQHLHLYQIDNDMLKGIQTGDKFNLSDVFNAERQAFERYLAERQASMSTAAYVAAYRLTG